MKQHKFSLAAMSIVFLVLPGLAAAQSWIQLSPAGTLPSPRTDTSAIYDPANNRMVIFAGNPIGCSFAASLNDTWVLTNANGLGNAPQWIQLFPSGGPPPVRRDHTAVYNPATNRMVVFGGDPVGCAVDKYNDVWVLEDANGIGSPNWTQLSPVGGPPPARSDHAAIYDPATNRMTVFGGFGPSGNLFDVWVLTHADGTGGTPQWIQLFPSGGPPSASSLNAEVYDSVSNRMTVAGGLTCCSVLTPTFETWILTNANGLGGTPQWIQLSTVGAPSSRAGHEAVYDASNNRMIILSGGTASAQVSEVWQLDNANGLGGTPQFTQLNPSGTAPLPRGGVVAETAAIFDQASGRVTIFGGRSGSTVLNDTWVLTTGKTNQPPVAVITGVPQSAVECAGPAGTQITLDGSRSHDPDGDTAFTYLWKLDGNQAGTGQATIITVPLGTHIVSLTVTDNGGLSSTTQATVIVRDTVPPSLSVSLSPNMLWPPNHKLVPITANIAVSDTCDFNPKVALVSIVANEPLEPNDIQGAILGIDDRGFSLTATRLGKGAGRVYTVTYSATDASGNSTTASSQVVVPHDQGNN